MSTGTLTGTYQRSDGTPLSGIVYARPSANPIKDEAGNVVFAGTAQARLDEDGHFTMPLVASDDLTLDPSGVTYTITLRGLPAVVGVFIPAGDTVDMADVTPVDPDAPAYAVQVSREEFDELAASVGSVSAIYFGPESDPPTGNWLLWYVTDPDTGLIIDATERVA